MFSGRNRVNKIWFNNIKGYDVVIKNNFVEENL